MKKSIKKIVSMLLLATMLLSTTIVASASEIAVAPVDIVDEKEDSATGKAIVYEIKGNNVNYRSYAGTNNPSYGQLHNGTEIKFL